MAFWKTWSELKQRFYLCVVLITLMMAPQTIATAVSSVHTVAPETGAAGDTPTGEQAVRSFNRMVDGWIRGDAHTIFAILATVLAVGGTMARSNARSNIMTLSLPERRRTWLIAQWAVASLLVVGLAIWEASIIAVTATVAGLDIPLASLAGAAVLTGLSATVWVWPGILATSLTRDAVKAALVVVSTIVAASTFTGMTGMLDWKLRHLADVVGWGEAVPWKPLAAGLVLTVVSARAVVRRFERADY